MSNFAAAEKRARTKILNTRIKNPANGNYIKVSSALKKGHPAYDIAKDMLKKHMKYHREERHKNKEQKHREKELHKSEFETVFKLINGKLLGQPVQRDRTTVYKQQIKHIEPGHVQASIGVGQYTTTHKFLNSLDPDIKKDIKSVEFTNVDRKLIGRNRGTVPSIAVDIKLHQPSLWKEDDYPSLSPDADRYLDNLSTEFSEKSGVKRSLSSKDLQWDELKKVNPKLHKKWLENISDLMEKEANFLEGELSSVDNPYYKQSLKKVLQMKDYADSQLNPTDPIPPRRKLDYVPDERGKLVMRLTTPESPQKSKSMFRRFFDYL